MLADMHNYAKALLLMCNRLFEVLIHIDITFLVLFDKYVCMYVCKYASMYACFYFRQLFIALWSVE